MEGKNAMSTPNPAPERIETQLRRRPEELLKRLIDFDPGQLPVISLYLDGRVDENGKHDFGPFVRKELTGRARTYRADSAERASFDEDFRRIERFLENEVRPSAQGIAIFACAGANDFFEVGEFDAPFKRHQLLVSDRPHLYPLARLIDQYRRYAVVLADTNRAKILVFATGATSGRKDVQNVKTKQSRAGGWTQSRYHRHLENYHLHHAKEVIQILDRTVRDEDINNVILAGDEATVIPILREQMSKELSEKVIDTLSLPIDTPDHELFEESQKAFRRYDSLSDLQKVERLMNEYRADDLAVAGVSETLVALSNGQVEEMLITASANDLKYDEAEAKKVLQAYGADDQESFDNRAIADELVRRATETSSARITFIEDASLLEPIGGVGAFIRYRISEERAAPYEQADAVAKSEALTEA
jgi:peptide chain release factor subunit 1